MNNIEAVKFFDKKVRSFYIKQMYWIAGSMDNQDFKDFIAEMYKHDWERLFPEVKNIKDSDDDEQDSRMDFLVNNNKYGLIAEIHHPKYYDFRFDENGKVKSASISMGSCRISYVYAETTDDLATAILLKCELMYNEYMKEDQRKREQKISSLK